jgi:predicted secreted protein
MHISPQTRQKAAGGSTTAPHAQLLSRWVTRAALVGALVPLLIGFTLYLAAVGKAIPYPYGLDPGEGNIWQQLREIAAGRGFGAIDGFPAIGFEYPPVYHLLVAGMASLTGLDQLVAGRSLSVIATIAMAGMIAMIIARMATDAGSTRRVAVVCGTLGGLMVFSLLPVLHWSRFMRVDMLALFFSFSGFYLGLRALERPRAVHFAALCFVAAIFTKQTSLPAPVAVFAVLVLLRPRTAWRGIGTGMAGALVALGYLCWQTDNGFLDHILFNNVNRMDYRRLLDIPVIVGFHSLYVGVALIGIVTYLAHRRHFYRGCRGLADYRKRLASSASDSQHAMLLGYLLFTTIMLATYAKIGATYNYFIEWFCVVTILVGLALRTAANHASGVPPTHGKCQAAPLILTALLPLAIAFQAAILPDIPQDEDNWSPAMKTQLDGLSQQIRASAKPVISDDMVLLIRSGKSVVWEPSIFAELASLGRWDDRPLIARIEHGDFAMFITADALGGVAYNNQEISDAIKRAYPVQKQVAGYTVHTPA